MGYCYVCGKYIWFWQEKVQSKDGLYSAHRECKPEGFHGEYKEEMKKTILDEIDKLKLKIRKAKLEIKEKEERLAML